MYWHQTNKDEGKDSGRTGDLATIPSISHNPVPVLFPPDNVFLKREMMETDQNPFNLGFYVDVHVQYLDNEPITYGLLSLNETIPLRKLGGEDVEG